MEDLKIYQPNELCFSIWKDTEEVDDSHLNLGWLVYFSRIDEFIKNGYLCDDLGGHNINNESLINSDNSPYNEI